MPSSALIQTDFLVLRKTPFGDTSLIVAGLTPIHGQLHFLARGARRLGKQNFPTVDLFRILNLEYRPGRTDLHTWKRADTVADFAAVATALPAYHTAGWLARLALANTCAEVDCRCLFAATATALERLATAARAGDSRAIPTDAAKVGVSLALLHDHGQLPHFAPNSAEQTRLRLLLEAAVGQRPPPDLPADTWRDLLAWSLSLLAAADCGLPPGTPDATPG